jgi:CrcB protein
MNEPWVAIALGGAGGALVRAGLIRLAEGSPSRSGRRSLDPAFAIVLANTIGCFLIGAWTGQLTATPGDVPAWIHALVMTGLCGGLTTFSTLCADATRLAKQESLWMAAGYLGFTTIFGLTAFLTGKWLPL